MKTSISMLLATTLGLACTLAQADPVLIINGITGDSPYTNNLKALHEAAGNVVIVNRDIPADLSAYKQVWDLRVTYAIDIEQRSQYLGFLQSGGGMFVVGEHHAYRERNWSIFSLIDLVGGGPVGASFLSYSCDGLQNVNAPFTGPNPVASVNFACSGVVANKGTGQWITERADGSGGSGIAWGVGDLLNASAGALTTIFDINFLENNPGEGQQNLAKNLIGFIGGQVDPPENNVPEPTTIALLGLGMLGVVLARRRVKDRQSSFPPMP